MTMRVVVVLVSSNLPRHVRRVRVCKGRPQPSDIYRGVGHDNDVSIDHAGTLERQEEGLSFLTGPNPIG